MPSKAVPFPIDEWPSVVIRGLEILNKHNWFPAMTLIIGSPNETDDDVKATLDVIYEVERRGLFAFFIPSIFTPLHDTRMEKKKGVTETNQLTALQWQLMMKCWKMNLRPGQASWWAPTVWRLGALGLWAWKLRKLNGPNFTWPMLLFASAMPEWLMAKMGKIYLGQPITVKTRKELLKTIKPAMRQFVRADTGDIPEDFATAASGGGAAVVHRADSTIFMKRFMLVSLLVIGIAVPAWAQSPDTILVNGKILTVDAQSSVREALAVRDGRIVALGTSAEIRKLAGPQSRVIDLQGRTVIPGLIDSHLHAIRAALSFTTEVNWIGVRTLEEALGRVKDAARTMKPGSWLIVAGGWNQQQFKENRRPTQAELVAVAPENPVYIQLGTRGRC